MDAVAAGQRNASPPANETSRSVLTLLGFLLSRKVAELPVDGSKVGFESPLHLLEFFPQLGPLLGRQLAVVDVIVKLPHNCPSVAVQGFQRSVEGMQCLSS